MTPTPTLEKEEAPSVAAPEAPEAPAEPQASEATEATETVAEASRSTEPEPPLVYSFQATTKRVAASGDAFQVLLEMSGQDWLRYVSNGLHKGTNTVIVKPEQIRWSPPESTFKPSTDCFFDEAIDSYQCKERPWTSSKEPCSHVLAETAAELDSETLAKAQAEDLGEPSANGNDSEAPKWYGRRRLPGGEIVEGKEPCDNPQCGRRASKDGHECSAIRALNPAPGSGSASEVDF